MPCDRGEMGVNERHEMTKPVLQGDEEGCSRVDVGCKCGGWNQLTARTEYVVLSVSAVWLAPIRICLQR